MTSLPLQKTFVDSYGVEITYFEWPVAAPKAVIQLVHGVGEHARRYDHVAEALNRAGYTVYADDHRGHGVTGQNMMLSGLTTKLGRLGPGGMDGVFAAVGQMGDIARAENPGLPVLLVGHSFGSYISQKIINKRSADYAALVLSGSSLVIPGFMATSNFNKNGKTPQTLLATNGLAATTQWVRLLPLTRSALTLTASTLARSPTAPQRSSAFLAARFAATFRFCF